MKRKDILTIKKYQNKPKKSQYNKAAELYVDIDKLLGFQNESDNHAPMDSWTAEEIKSLRESGDL